MSLYGENRGDHRKIVFDVWRKYQDQQTLGLLEEKILAVILKHPEYFKVVADPEKYMTTNYFPELGETNPFLHFSLHLTVLEQIQTNQPLGITDLYKQVLERFKDEHAADHCFMHSLAIALQEVMHENKPFNEKAYLKRIKIAVKNGYW